MTDKQNPTGAMSTLELQYIMSRRLGLSCQHLADLSGISADMWTRLCRGRYAVSPPQARVLRLAAKDSRWLSLMGAYGRPLTFTGPVPVYTRGRKAGPVAPGGNHQASGPGDAGTATQRELRQIAAGLGASQSRLARALGLAPRTARDWLRPIRPTTPNPLILRILRAAYVNPELLELLEADPAPVRVPPAFKPPVLGRVKRDRAALAEAVAKRQPAKDTGKMLPPPGAGFAS